MSRVLVLLLLFAAACSSCFGEGAVSTQVPASPASGPAAGLPASYRLQTDDMMKISVWGEPNLSCEQMVDPNGNISVPHAGTIHAEGLTQSELIQKIGEGLKDILRTPKVQVDIIQFRRPKVYVLGQVNKPGLFEFKPGDSVMEAIAQAGSFTDAAYMEHATLTPKGSKTATELNLRKLFYENDLSLNRTLSDGDTIWVPEDVTNKYYVFGQVAHPSMFRLKGHVTVMEAVSVAGGVTTRGDIKATYILRGDPKKPEKIRVDMDKCIKKGDMAANLELQPGDAVYVAETKKPDWGMVGSVLGAIVNSSWLIRSWGL